MLYSDVLSLLTFSLGQVSQSDYVRWFYSLGFSLVRRVIRVDDASIFADRVKGTPCFGMKVQHKHRLQ